MALINGVDIREALLLVIMEQYFVGRGMLMNLIVNGLFVHMIVNLTYMSSFR